MAEIVPTIGRIVIYTLSTDDAVKINKRRDDAVLSRHSNGVMVHVGNEVMEGNEYPAIVVEVWGDRPDSPINLKVELDGSDAFWAGSRKVGTGPGTYHWMEYQKG
jgi:hypothetical protein